MVSKYTMETPYDPVYVTQSLLPTLIDFWNQQVLPAFEERDQIGRDNLPVGWVPSKKRKVDEGP